jgi:hypothetical protein
MDRPTTAVRVWLQRAIVAGLLAIAICFGFLTVKVGAVTKSELLLEKEPKGAVDVLALRKDVKDKQDVVVIGRIGGRKNPWVKGAAVFPIVDRSLKPCNEIEGDTCPTPWDYCCAVNVPKATVLVMFVDEKGKVVKKDPRELLHVKELQTVVVQGKAKRDKAGNVTILASKVHIRNDEEAKE